MIEEDAMQEVTRWVTVRQARPDRAVPLVCDSPHSGLHYPADFDHSIPRALLRTGEDTHIDQLWSHAPEAGATLICAEFPRSYIDPNRSLSDIDPSMLAEPWPDGLAPTRKAELGIGLIWRQVSTGTPIYSRKLSVSEVRARIENCWAPYHAALRSALEQVRQRHGAYWHLNLHSMPHNAYQRLGLESKPLADFVLGDRRGKTCDARFVQTVRAAIEKRGYSVALNDPYEGQELVRLHGEPSQRRHSLQIEVKRALYMDETSRERHSAFDRVQADIAGVLDDVACYVRTQCAAAQSA